MKKAIFNATFVAALMGLSALPVWANPVNQDTAEMAAQAWAVRGDTLGAKMGDYIESSTVHTTDTGAKFYTVKTRGGGTIIMTSDDELEPVLAFTDEEADLSTLDKNSPLWAFLNRHVSGMAIALKNQPKMAAALGGPSALPGTAQKRWAALIAKGEEIRQNGLPKMSDTWRRDADITDMRVPALCKAKWQQMGNGYNYYTPNNYACGCVATAQSQIMRKHCWPTGEVEKVTKTCRVDGVSTNLTTFGGVFDWANMPFSGGHTDIQRQAVGKLCRDVGVTLNMSYSKGGSGSTTPKVMYSLVNNFQYAGAVCLQYAYNAFGEYGEEWPESRRECLERVFFSNFDAGLPVSVGIPGHEVLADGYGFIDDLEYIHFNFGWAGISTCWYYVPDLTGAGSEYSYVDDLVYNINMTNDISYAVVSGRVLDHLGKPLSDIEVKMFDRDVDGGQWIDSTYTDSRGIWYFIVKAGKWNGKSEGDLIDRTTRHLDFAVDEMWNFRAAKIENVSVDCPTRYRLYYYTSDKPSKLGNSWGNDIQLELRNADYPEVPNVGATFEWHVEGDTKIVDEDDFGGLAKESYYGKFWWGSDVEGEVKDGKFASFTGLVYRAIHNTYDVTNVAAKAVSEFVPEEIGTDGFVFDAMVRLDEVKVEGGGGQWTPFLPDENLKIAVMVKGGKLAVIAGDGVNDHSTKVYETSRAVDSDGMHRLTLRAEEVHICSEPKPHATSYGSEQNMHFLVWLDGAFVGEYPSCILAGTEAQQVRSMGFAGLGVDADNVYTTREMPPFEEPVTITLPDSAHMTRSVTCEGAPVLPTTAGGNQYAVATGVVLTVTYTPEPDYYPTTPVVRTLTVEDEHSTIPEGEVPKVHEAYAKVGDVRYGTLEEALAAANEGATVVLLADFTSDITQLIDKNLTLDMNEMHLTNGAHIGWRIKSGAKLVVTGVGKMSGDVLFFLDWGGDVEIRNGDFSDCNKVILRAMMWYLK